MLYGIYGSHTPEVCPIYVPDNARVFVSIAETSPGAARRTVRGIQRIEARYHSALEHTFLWIVEAEDPYRIEAFSIDTGLASFNTVKIVPLHSFEETVQRLRDAHDL